MKKVKKKINWGNRLTVLENEEAKQLLKKYERDINRECSKRSHLPGIGIEDLVQECKISILEHYHEFTSKKAQERTWAMRIITTTLNRIWNKSLKQIRTCYVPSEDGEKPVYNLNFEAQFPDGNGKFSSLEESYVGSPDGRPVFGSYSFTPEENFEVREILKHLKKNMQKDIFSFLKEKITAPPKKKKKKTPTIEEKQTLQEIANFFIKELGYTEREIYQRQDIVDLF